jgi:oligoribonuclease NrnB/cAMP/cGMP phosphodiesterase (DHH superfamily)/ADP-ribose pyrophosphatase YjhB (NUDIX family)
MDKITASCVVIIEDGKLLVSRDWQDSFYKLPGGKLKDDEDLESCALRRLHAETSFEADILGELPSFEIDKKPVTGEDVQIELFQFKAELKKKPEVFEGFDYADYEVRWLNIRDILEGEYEVAPNIRNLIESQEIEPWINYLIGTKKRFYEFIELITSRDKVAILTHTDPDGLISGVLLEKILNALKLEVSTIRFLDMEKDMVKKILVKLKEENISKVFFCDLGVDNADPEGLKEMSQEMDFFILDHHPMNDEFEYKNNLIKVSSDDCAAMLVYDLGRDVFEVKEHNWLLGVAMFADYSYNTIKNFEILKRIYPTITKENLSGSVPGINARKINSAMTYYRGDLDHVYEIVKNRDLEKLSEVHDIIEDEVNKLVDDFSENEKFYPEKELHLYELKSSFRLSSTLSSIISKMKGKGTFVIYQKWKDGVHISARNQGDYLDMGELLQESITNLEGASGGGHKRAAGARVNESDLKEFLENVINLSKLAR